MGLFSKKKTLEEEAKEEDIVRTMNKNIMKGKKVELFLGNLAEYEQLKGKKYELIKLPGTIKYTYYDHYDTELLEHIGKLGIEALIRFQLKVYGNIDHTETEPRQGYGIPVKEKKQ